MKFDDKTINAAFKDCKSIIKEGSKSFYAASLLLPPEIRNASIALYAFCRISDDIADEPKANLEALEGLRARLDAAYFGMPYDDPVDIAFAATVQKYDIPKQVPLSMFEGFEWDITGKHYETLSDVIDYSARVAGTVGVMMSLIMGRREARTLARASDLGLAMQLTNIARDVGEDARNGRVYLPESWLAKEGLSSKGLIANPEHSEALGRVVKHLLDTAGDVFDRAITGVADLPSLCRPSIRAAAFIYREIGKEVAKNDYNSVDYRAHTTKARKLALLVKSAPHPFAYDICDPQPPLNELAYLVDAAASQETMAPSTAEWMLDLFGTLHQKDEEYLSRVRNPA